ncbi:MAG: hypothetical protein V7K98_01105 [Nostoc sp.]|uniref:hypothetical protein n=1 Tax=Nostoc sp. TaxID=1180 RepID=UPI002FF4A413
MPNSQCPMPNAQFPIPNPLQWICNVSLEVDIPAGWLRRSFHCFEIFLKHLFYVFFQF